MTESSAQPNPSLPPASKPPGSLQNLQMTEYKTGKRIVACVPDYVIFDLETTGTDYHKDQIVEISALRAENGIVTDVFSTLVNPQCPIPYRVTQIHGITDEMVADAPTLSQALPEFFAFIKDRVLVGHNIQAFDLKFIYKAAKELYGTDVSNDYLDTLYLARQCLPQLGHHKLTDVAAYFQIDTQGAHRALADCMMNQQCYERLAKIQKEMKQELCPVCGGELKKRKGRYGEFYGCSNFPKCRYTRKM